MIELKQIAEQINKVLNEEAQNYPILNSGRIKYVFNIVAHTKNYKKATIEGNTAIYYLNGILSQNGSTVEGEGYVSAIINSTLVVAVPVKTGSSDTTPELVSTIGAVINSAFSKNAVSDITDKEGKKYTLGMNFNLLNDGERDILPMLGDSYTFSMYMSFYLIENGVNSNDIVYYMYDESTQSRDNRIFMITGGMTRGAQQETQVTSASEGVAKSITTATVLTFTFVTPMRYDYVSKEISDFINTGKSKVYTIQKKKLYKDDASPVDPNVIPEYFTYKMVFSEASESYDTVKNVGLQVTMVEVLE